jgi:hypothetical protein
MRLREAGFVCEHYGLDAVAEVEFAEQPVDVRLDGRFADDEFGGVWGALSRFRVGGAGSRS